MLVGSLAMAAYYLHLNYFDQTTHLTRDFFAELLDSSGFRRQSTATFLRSKYMTGKRGQQQQQQPLSKYLQKYCFLVLNSLPVFIPAIGNSFAFVYLLFVS